MIRKIFKKQSSNKRIDALIKKYKVPQTYLAVTKKTVANAFSIGLFFAMIPMPFQMLAILLCIPFVKFNVPLGLSLVWITNPFTMPFIFYGEYLLGNWVLSKEKIGEVLLTMDWFKNNLDNIFFPLIVGALIAGIVLAITSRYLVFLLWKRSVYKQIRKKRSPKI